MHKGWMNTILYMSEAKGKRGRGRLRVGAVEKNEGVQHMVKMDLGMEECLDVCRLEGESVLASLLVNRRQNIT